MVRGKASPEREGKMHCRSHCYICVSSIGELVTSPMQRVAACAVFLYTRVPVQLAAQAQVMAWSDPARGALDSAMLLAMHGEQQPLPSNYP